MFWKEVLEFCGLKSDETAATVADVASGFVPVLGEIADVTELALDIKNGDTTGAAISVAAVLIPFGGAKLIKKIVGHTADAAKAGKRVVKAADEVAEAGGTTANRVHRHHSDPKFIGGDPKQPLTKLPADQHKALHKELNDFLRKKENELGQHMRPQRGNSGADIQENFEREELLDAMKEFYTTGPGAKYKDAADDFFKQHPELKP